MSNSGSEAMKCQNSNTGSCWICSICAVVTLELPLYNNSLIHRMNPHDIYSYSVWLMEKKSSSCVLQVRLPLCCLPLQRRLHRLISLLKRIESLALLTHTNWNLTRVSKSFLFPTGAFRGYKTPAKMTGSHFLSPFCLPSLHSLYSLVALFVLLPARWHLNIPSPLSPLPSSPYFFCLLLSLRTSIMFSQSRVLYS